MEGDNSSIEDSKPIHDATAKSGQKSGPQSNSTRGFVRADLVNLADLDAVLEKHLISKFSGKKLLSREREKEDWEADLTKLVLMDVLARGTYGVVHRGIYDGRDVAVKVLDWGEETHKSAAEVASLRSSFKQEVAVWHKLDHPNVTKFIGASMGDTEFQIPGLEGDQVNVCCVIVEYVAGGTLKKFLIRHWRKKLSLKTVIQLSLDLSRGLDYLHSQKIVHRDVKSENMLLDTTRRLKIADFGVARVEAQNRTEMTGETGTVGYMAPEVLNGKGYDRKCDVYSFGICLWEIYCCEMPYPDLTFAETSTAVVKQNVRPEIPRCCPSSLASIMRKCWDANPDKRPNMNEVVSLLEAIDTSKGGGMIPVGSEPQGCLCFGRYHGP
ncbi:hypothetical protein O6H91_13G057900 [Diphasiastrum complanatum]|uniref:Uncharacterized protein n=1 Tax=Diphasiastrum complanatum TaxID=34168 RepID=A0ACC2BVR3_DIPCM|nr:hypothetical protein O6H91_13G057900 [Diphasiastrum complanatum]